MAKTAREIAALFHERQAARGEYEARMDRVRTTYNGDLVIPLPELDETEKSTVVNLVAQGIDQLSSRIASTMPDVSYPVLHPGYEASESRARKRRLATLGWWDMNDMPLILRRRCRYLIAYGSAPVTLSGVSAKPSDKREIPFWRPRNPLSTFLPLPNYEGDYEPEDAIFCSRQGRGWLEARYPTAMARLSKGDEGPDDRFDVLEYTDATEHVLVVCGKHTSAAETQRAPYGRAAPAPTGTMEEELERTPNRAHIPLVVCPSRIVLDRLSGMFDQLPELMQMGGKLASLEYIGMRRATFKDQYLVTHPTSQQTATIVTPADGLRGTIGEIQGGQIQELTGAPSPLVAQTIDRLERNERVTAGLPSEFGGESPTNIRTAKRGGEVLAATITMPIAEAQDILQASIEAENVRAIALTKATRKGKVYSFYQPRSGPPDMLPVGTETYAVDVDFETDMQFVKWSIPGTDAAALPIEIGQRIGTQEISLQTAREMDPVVEDPILERARVDSEGLRRAMLTGMEQQAAAGALSPDVIARITKALMGPEHPMLEDAVLTVHQELQKEQAQQAPAPTAQPETQPGMAQPSPVAGTQAPVPPPAQGQTNLAQVLQTLRRPTNQGPAERALTAAPAGAAVG